MKQAIQLPQYSDTNDFTPPDGVEIVTLDKNTNLLADAACPDDYTAASSTAPRPPIPATTRPITATSCRRSSAWASRGTSALLEGLCGYAPRPLLG